MCPLCPLPPQNSVRARFFGNLRKSKKKLDKGIARFEALEREIRGPRTIKPDKQTGQDSTLSILIDGKCQNLLTAFLEHSHC